MKFEGKRFLVPVLLILATAVVSLNAWFAFRAIQELLESEQWVQHTWQVISQVETIMSSAKDAESGSRGYLITGDLAYLQPYYSALKRLPAQMAQFKQLSRDNTVQQNNAIEMEAVLDQRLVLLQQGINLRQSGRADSLHALVVSGTGQIQMDHLRRIADAMESEEHRLLLLRVRDTQQDSFHARLTIAIASCIDFCLIILMFRYFARERSLRFASEETAERLAIARAEAEANAEEVRSLNATLEERVRLRTVELETTNRELEAFSYSVSHDLRAPLRTIDGFSLALAEDYMEAVGPTGRDYIQRVRNGVQRMGELIDALLQLSRITRASIACESFDLSELAREVATELKEQNPERDIRFQIESGLTMDADPRLIRIALENLFGNAVKFSSREKHALIEFGWDAERSAWYVRDNGAGFDMHYAGKLFNAFNRLHGDKDFKGSGIGLATVARVIHRHHGEIWAQGEVDHGATFWFTVG